MPKCSARTKTDAKCRNNALKGCDTCRIHEKKLLEEVIPSNDSEESDYTVVDPTPPLSEGDELSVTPDAASTIVRAPDETPDDLDVSDGVSVNDSPVQKNVDRRPKAPKNARPAGEKAASIDSLDARVEIMTTAHFARGSLGTAGDKPSRRGGLRGGWLGLLKRIASEELSKDATLDEFKNRFSECCVDVAIGEPCGKKATVGAHVWIRRRLENGRYGYEHDRVFIVPTCSTHNGPEFSHQNNGMCIRKGTVAMSMLPKADYYDFYGVVKK